MNFASFSNCEKQTFLATEDLRLCLLSFDTEIPFIFFIKVVKHIIKRWEDLQLQFFTVISSVIGHLKSVQYGCVKRSQKIIVERVSVKGLKLKMNCCNRLVVELCCCSLETGTKVIGIFQIVRLQCTYIFVKLASFLV